MNPDVYRCVDDEDYHCRACDPPGLCKECRQELCSVCHEHSHQSDRRGLCLWCAYHQSGHAEEEELTEYQKLMRLPPHEFAKRVAAQPMPWPRPGARKKRR